VSRDDKVSPKLVEKASQKIKAVDGQPPSTASHARCLACHHRVRQRGGALKPRSQGALVSPRTLQIVIGRRGSAFSELQPLPRTSRSILPWGRTSEEAATPRSPPTRVAHFRKPSSSSPSRTAGNSRPVSNLGSALKTSHVCAGTHFASSQTKLQRKFAVALCRSCGGRKFFVEEDGKVCEYFDLISTILPRGPPVSRMKES
jgi:hypothetical protein